MTVRLDEMKIRAFELVLVANVNIRPELEDKGFTADEVRELCRLAIVGAEFSRLVLSQHTRRDVAEGLPALSYRLQQVRGLHTELVEYTEHHGDVKMQELLRRLGDVLDDAGRRKVTYRDEAAEFTEVEQESETRSRAKTAWAAWRKKARRIRDDLQKSEPVGASPIVELLLEVEELP